MVTTRPNHSHWITLESNYQEFIMPRSRHKLLQTLLPVLLLLLSACAGSPRTISISESELQSRITEELSVPTALLRIFDVNLSNPVIHLDGEAQRLHARIDTRISNPLTQKSLQGMIGISGKLGFDAASSTVMLSESKVENLDIQGMELSDTHNELLNLLAAKLGAELLSNIPLHTFKPDDLKIGNRRYAPTDFRIEGHNLKITLLPQ
jgi:hypothetical protein